MVRWANGMDGCAMSPDTIFFAISMLVLIIGCILFVIFGQKTVRKLRKNPDTKHALGIEFVSGYDIFNVMAALTFPKLTNKLKSSPLSASFADPKLLEKYTTPFDRILAKVSSILLVSSIFSLFMLSYLLKIKFFE
jgi:hypothetical protein